MRKDTKARDFDRKVKQAISERDSYDGWPCCVNCGLAAPTPLAWSNAHFISRAQGGLARKTEYLRNVESVIGLKRGLLSEVEAVERTAKEVTSSEGDYNLTIVDFQQAWEDAVKEAARLCGILGQMYRVPGAHEIGEDGIAFDWGNGVLYDDEKTWEDMKDQVARGMLKPEIAVGWRYGMPYDTEAQRKKIREKYMPEIEELTDGGEE